MSIDPAHNRRIRNYHAAKAASSAYAESSAGKPASFSQLRDVLPLNTVLCEIVWRDPRLFLLLIRAGQTDPTAIIVPFQQIESLNADVERDPAGLQQVLRPLTQALVTHTEVGETIWIVPDGPLHDLPLHAGSIKGIPLGERNPMCVSPNASIMLPYLSRTPQPPPRRALILGDPMGNLPHASAEAQAISPLFGKSDLFTGSTARSQNLLQRVKQKEYDVVHLACHCTVNYDQPALSRLHLADGEFPVLDLDQIPASTRLVTLSGCGTGTQRHRRGNELVGPARVLLHSRVSAVLISHWTVNDFSTALLMEDFYQEWQQGHSIAEALSIARGKLRRLSCSDAIARCKAWLDAPGNEKIASQIESEITRLEARSAAAKLSTATNDPREHIRIMRAALQQSQHDRTTPAFDNPYHLASFTLIGDWR
nr:CHAT domain-containing protein [Nocardiopsis sinuspersici]